MKHVIYILLGALVILALAVLFALMRIITFKGFAIAAVSISLCYFIGKAIYNRFFE